MWQGKIVAQGKLLLRGPLLCTDDPASGPNFRLKEMTVFLFEQIMIFAMTEGRKTQFTTPVYTYKAHIQVKVQYVCTIFSPLCENHWDIAPQRQRNLRAALVVQSSGNLIFSSG